MSAPKNAYPIGKPARDGGKPEEIESLKEIPNFECICGHSGLGELLLGVDDEDTLWCPSCRNATWTWTYTEAEQKIIDSGNSEEIEKLTGFTADELKILNSGNPEEVLKAANITADELKIIESGDPEKITKLLRERRAFGHDDRN